MRGRWSWKQNSVDLNFGGRGGPATERTPNLGRLPSPAIFCSSLLSTSTGVSAPQNSMKVALWRCPRAGSPLRRLKLKLAYSHPYSKLGGLSSIRSGDIWRLYAIAKLVLVPGGHTSSSPSDSTPPPRQRDDDCNHGGGGAARA